MSWNALITRIAPDRIGSFVSGVGKAVRGLVPWGWFSPKPPSKQLAFTMAFVGLAAKMAKADGVAVEVETQAFERCFFVPPEERANVDRVYRLAAQDVAGFEVYAERIARLLADEPALLRDVFECLFNIAAADGVLHSAEEAFLEEVARRFGFDEREYRRVRSLFVRDPDSPYEVLGLPPDASDEELAARRKALVRENHPDRLAAEGVPIEFLVIADRKMAAINAAYDAIRAERGLKSSGVKSTEPSND